MIALYIPMQPSSKTPMIALRRRKSAAISPASVLARGGAEAGSKAWTCEASWVTRPSVSHWPSFRLNGSSVKVSLHRVE